MIYFAYGSNLDRMQMAERCPNGGLIGPARLADHRLCFPRRSPIRKCAVASIEPIAGETVWGVLYELGDNDLGRLDAREGYDPADPSAANRYRRVDVMVELPRGGRTVATTYVAVPDADPGLPSARYMWHIIEGAVAHGFPDAYVAMLKAVPVADVV